MRLRSKLISLSLLVALVGCAPVPIKNMDNVPVTAASTKTLKLSEVREAIVRAGASLGWQMKDDGPNKLIGTLNIRKHTAVVEIPYSETSYSIKYVSSTNLDAKDGKIHKNYNGWISNLTRDIDIQLADR